MAQGLPPLGPGWVRLGPGGSGAELAGPHPSGAMAELWIVHRDARTRAALARLAGAGEEALLGEPSEYAFASAGAPRAVLLGLEGDLEAELEFAHRTVRRAPDTHWILVCAPGERGEAARLFDALPAEQLSWPPPARELRARLRRALAVRRRAEALSARHLRDRVAERFARYFADLELPELLRALDPKLAGVPLLVRGEPGTGRGLLARYVHAFGGAARGRLRPVPGRVVRSAGELEAALAGGAPEAGELDAWATVVLEDADALPGVVQESLRRWIELAPPPALLRARQVHWIATVADAPPLELEEAGGLDPGLAQALSGIEVRVPPLRERPGAVEPFASDTALAWARERGEAARRFASDALDALRAYPWPGNLRELESVVVRTLAATEASPVREADLRFDPPGRASPETPHAGAEAPDRREAPEPAGEEAEASPPGQAGGPPARARAGEPEGGERAAPAGGPASEAAPEEAAEGELRRLVRALAHAVRNPLVGIRTFASLLPERFDDPEFRERFQERVRQDVSRLEEVLERLAGFAERGPSEPQPVDVAALLERLLDERRGEIQARRLLVLKELDATRPYALGDETKLRLAFETLLDQALAAAPERGDLYLASKHHATGLRGGPSLRVLLRFHGAGAPAAGEGVGPEAAAELAPAENALEQVVAELVIRTQRGRLHTEGASGDETVWVVDLPAPEE